jgi:hypothetical protein
MAYFISSSSSITSFPSLPTSGGCKSRRLINRPRIVQVARHQGGRTAIDTKSRKTTFSARVITTQRTARGRMIR